MYMRFSFLKYGPPVLIYYYYHHHRHTIAVLYYTFTLFISHFTAAIHLLNIIIYEYTARGGTLAGIFAALKEY